MMYACSAAKPHVWHCSAVAGELNVAALEPSLQGQVAAAREEVASLQQSVQDLEMEQQ